MLWRGKPVPGTVLDDGALTQEEVRSTLNSTATQFSTQDFGPLCSADTAVNDALRALQVEVPLPVSPTPWVEIGWGFVGDDAADLAVKVITGQTAAPSKPAEAKQYMDQVMQVREFMYPG